jgi:two-component system nitrate/nitrite response regulator NarL
MRIRVAIADWQLLVVDGLEAMLRGHHGIEVVGRATEADELLRVIDGCAPDVVILSRVLPARSGLDVVRVLRQGQSRAAIVLLAAEISDRDLGDAKALGIGAVILKGACSGEKLRQCIRRVANGGRWFEASSTILPQRNGTKARLSSREVDVARHVATGLRNREIAEKLFIAESTVKVHLKKIYEKVKVHNRVALTVYAREHGLLNAEE